MHIEGLVLVVIGNRVLQQQRDVEVELGERSVVTPLHQGSIEAFKLMDGEKRCHMRKMMKAYNRWWRRHSYHGMTHYSPADITKGNGLWHRAIVIRDEISIHREVELHSTRVCHDVT